MVVEPRVYSGSREMASKHVSLPSAFSEGDPTEWFKRFEICSTANDWDDAMQAKKMPTLLEGEALAIWLDLSEDDQKNYSEAKKIIGHLAPMSFVSLDDFHARRLRPGESLPVFVHSLKRLLGQAMPDVEEGTRKQLLRHQFLAGLHAAVSKQLCATGEIDDLDKMVDRAKLLLTLDHEERAATVSSPTTGSGVTLLQQQVATLIEQVAALTSGRAPTNSTNSRRRYRCHQPGHVQWNCPLLRRCFACGRQGHLAKDCRSGNVKGMPQAGWGHPQPQ